MIDIHCHILPGVDDGVRTMDEALALARVECSGGTSVFLATSHVMEQRDFETLPLRAEILQTVQSELDGQGIAVKVLPGAEVYPFPAVLKALDSGAPLSAAGTGKYMLVDLPLTQFPNDLDTFLFEIQSRGLTPILAHPERTAPVQQNPEILRPMMEKGIVLQVNAGSVLGQYGPGATKSAYYILERCWAHFLASDSHRPSQTPKLERAISALEGTLTSKYIDMLTEQSGRCVLNAQPLPERPMPQAKKPSFWAKLFTR